jgi:c-di-GMP-binding flagellar brake protein YcgR
MPGVHRLVTITDSDGREYCSRVEDVGDGLLVFARPLTLPVEHEFAVGQPLLASWPDPDGLTLATVTLIETRAREHLGLWVTAVEDLRRQQRRQYVRVPAAGPLELTATEGGPIAGRLLDVSEAALRCALRTADAEAMAGAPGLLASFTLAEARFSVPATLLRTEPSRRDDQLAECVLTFDMDEREAAELRRRVFAEQLRLRHARTLAAS